MSKYIVVIPDGVEWGVVTCRTEDGFYTRDFDSLEELNSDYINKHYEGLQDEAYQRGLDDAWEAARKIVGYTDHGGLTVDALGEVFGTSSYSCIVRDNTAQEAIDKIKAYEEKQKAADDIKVGDEVEVINGGNKYTITWIVGTALRGFGHDGLMCHISQKDVRKTGRHFDIDKILEEMKE